MLHRQSPGAGRGMAEIGRAVLEEAAALHDGLVYRPGDHQGADRLIAGAKALGDGDHVGNHALALEGPHRAAAAHAAHHFVEDQQDAVAIADLAHAFEVARYRRWGAQRWTRDRFLDDGAYRVAAPALAPRPERG